MSPVPVSSLSTLPQNLGFTGAEPFLSHLLFPRTDVAHNNCSIDTEDELRIQMKSLEMGLEIPGSSASKLTKVHGG